MEHLSSLLELLTIKKKNQTLNIPTLQIIV